MTTEEVIAIAKTLRPGYRDIACNTMCIAIEDVYYRIYYDGFVANSTRSWEEALCNAGWKG